jgi:hypothetical protein
MNFYSDLIKKDIIDVLKKSNSIIGGSNIYLQKYLKYKKKYLNLKSNII